jgi:pyruvate/2-oxoglutarate dehydrogenase complex dihydrolipoamide acyltransferase (E2) component
VARSFRVNYSNETRLYLSNNSKADKLAAGSERGVAALEARNYATQHGARYHETSAATGKGIAELFEDVAAHFAAQRAGTAPAKANAAANNASQPNGNNNNCKQDDVLCLSLLTVVWICLSEKRSDREASSAKPVNLNEKRKPKKQAGGGGCCD